MLCSACDLPLCAGEPRVYVDDEAVHAHHDLSGADAVCGICWTVHAPAQKRCEW